jgi:hypothetical protein
MSASKKDLEKRIAELEKEIERIQPSAPILTKLKIFGKPKAVVKESILSDSQAFVTFSDNPKSRRRYYLKKTNGVTVLEYTED